MDYYTKYLAIRWIFQVFQFFGLYSINKNKTSRLFCQLMAILVVLVISVSCIITSMNFDGVDQGSFAGVFAFVEC